MEKKKVSEVKSFENRCFAVILSDDFEKEGKMSYFFVDKAVQDGHEQTLRLQKTSHMNLIHLHSSHSRYNQSLFEMI